MRQYRSLPDARRMHLSDTKRGGGGVSIVRDVRYAKADRAVMDIYLPRGVQFSDDMAGNQLAAAAAAVAAAEASNQHQHPVALFVHGGVWAVGEKWQFAPMVGRCSLEPG